MPFWLRLFGTTGIMPFDLRSSMARYIPLYRQSFGYSCGPASLLMVIGSLDEEMAMNKEQEITIWEDANLVESRATSAHGLALAALRRGFGARVYANSIGIGFTSRLKEHFPDIDLERMDDLFEKTRLEAKKMGLEEMIEDITLDTLREELRKGLTPIVLISTGLMGETEEIPHWVVVTGIDEGSVTIQNPEHARVEKYPLVRFAKYLGFRGSNRFVCIFGQQGTPADLSMPDNGPDRRTTL